MTRLDLATSAAKGALSFVLLAASGYAQTHKEATIAASLFGRTSRELPVAALNSKLRPHVAVSSSSP